jgi:hypothetical protein
MPDTDRHASGLFCFAKDHLRATTEEDSEVPPLRLAQEKEDYLTDSESDNEDAYQTHRPSMSGVKEMLNLPIVKEVKVDAVPDPKAKKGAEKNAAKKEVAKSVSVDIQSPAVSPLKGANDAFSVLDENSRQIDQVELLRDRKVIDLNLYMRKQRYDNEDEFVQRYNIQLYY